MPSPASTRLTGHSRGASRPSLDAHDAGALSPNAGRRRHARARLAIPARLTTIGDTLSCLIEDVSVSGARLACPCSLPLGTRCIVECEIECLFGHVVRTQGESCAIELIEPLTRDQVVALRRFSDSLPRRAREELREAARAWALGLR